MASRQCELTSRNTKTNEMKINLAFSPTKGRWGQCKDELRMIWTLQRRQRMTYEYTVTLPNMPLTYWFFKVLSVINWKLILCYKSTPQAMALSIFFVCLPTIPSRRAYMPQQSYLHILVLLYYIIIIILYSCIVVVFLLVFLITSMFILKILVLKSN